jgi:Na+-translocating ferredoxin:NAD+ oxidoreductase RnfG subunit
MVPLIAFTEINLNTILLALFGAVSAYYMAVIKKDVNSNTKAAAVREEALRLVIEHERSAAAAAIKAKDAMISDLREQRAATGASNPQPLALGEQPPLVVQMEATVGPKKEEQDK